MISGSLLDNMEKRLNDLQNPEQKSVGFSGGSTGRSYPQHQQNQQVRSPAVGGVESTRKYSDLQRQMDQMLGMVRNETENVRSLESQLYSRGAEPSTGAGSRSTSLPPPISSHANDSSNVHPPKIPPEPQTMHSPLLPRPPPNSRLSSQSFSHQQPQQFTNHHSRGGVPPGALGAPSTDQFPPHFQYQLQPQSANQGGDLQWGGMSSKDFERQLTSLLTRSRSSAGGGGNGDNSNSAQIKTELDAVIAGLTEYLNHMRFELERLRKENEALKIQMAEQHAKLSESENEKKLIQNEKTELEKIHEQARELMLKLQNSERSNEDLRKELDKYPSYNVLEQMKESERDLQLLKVTLGQQKDEYRNDRETILAQLKNEQRKCEELQHRLNESDKIDKEYNHLQVQFASVQATRDSLREQVASLEQELRNHTESAIKLEDLLRHVNEMTLNIERGQGADLVPFHEHDLSGKALSDVQKVINSTFNKHKREMENLQNLINSLQRDNKDIEEGLNNERERHRKTKEQSQQQRQHDKVQFEEKVKQWQEQTRAIKETSENERDQLEQEVQRIEGERRQLEKEVREIEKHYLKKELAGSDKFHRLQTEVSDLKDVVKSNNESHNNQIISYEKQLSELERKVEEKDHKCQQLDKACGLLERDLTKSQLEAEQLQRQIVDVNAKLTSEQNACEKHQDTIEVLRSEDAKLKSVVKVQKEDIAKLSQLFEKALEGGIHNEEVAKLTLEVGRLQMVIGEQEETIRKLKEELRVAELNGQQPRFIHDSTVPPPATIGAEQHVNTSSLASGAAGSLHDRQVVRQTNDTNAGLYCNVLQHHKLEDYISVLKNKLEKSYKGRKIETSVRRQSKELDNVLSQLEKSRGELEQAEAQLKIVNKKYKLTTERVQQFERALASVGGLEVEIVEYLHGGGGLEGNSGINSGALLPERVAEALRRYVKGKEELEQVEQHLVELRREAEDAEARLRQLEAESASVSEKTESVVRVYSETRKQLNKSQKEAKKLIEQMGATGRELKEASSALVTMRSHLEAVERRKEEAEADLKDINKIIGKKSVEYQSMEERRSRAKESAEDIRSREDELFSHLKASEKAVVDRKNELEMLEAQSQQEAESLQQLQTELDRKRLELDNVKEELSGKQEELSVLLKEAQDDMNRKTRELKDSKADLDSVQVEMREYESVKSGKLKELNELRDNVDTEENNLTNLKHCIATSSNELKQLREMITKEKSELDSLRNERTAVNNNNDDYSNKFNLDF